jgi:hypothetical protein
MMFKCPKALIILAGMFFSMSTFSSELVLFSPVTGLVTLNGKPVKGAELTHRYKWKNEEFIEKVNTDNTGRFSFSKNRINLCSGLCFLTTLVSVRNSP